MKYVVIAFIFICSSWAWASQKAKIVSPQVEIYEKADFDSEVIELVYESESYLISDKPIGAFYKIKLKDGRIGFIADYEVDIAGKGRIPEKDFDEVFQQDMREPKTESGQDPEEEAVFGRPLGGPTIQLVNYRENTMGSDQMADLLAVGYKSVHLLSWSLIGTYGAPKYYADKTGGQAQGAKIWGDIGFSSTLVYFKKSEVRFGGSFFTHLSYVSVETPAKKYSLNDVTLGVALELAYQYKLQTSAIDFSVKYYFDKVAYSAIGLSYLF